MPCSTGTKSRLPFHCEQIRDHLPSNRKRRSISVSFLFLSRVEQDYDPVGGQLRSISTNWIFLLRCLEIGVRIDFSADLLSSPQSPQ
jgi:hypothetical protein